MPETSNEDRIMKVMVNIEVDVPDKFVKNGEPDISVEVFGWSDNQPTRLYQDQTYIFKESEMTKF